MIFDNEVTSGQVINSTIWNRAWGLNGTAKTLYDMIGGQQSATQAYSAGSWAGGKQSFTAESVIQYSFITGTYPSSIRSGDLITWSPGFSIANNLRDSLIILRDGYYVIHVEVGVNDNANRIGNSLNADGTATVPNIALTVTLDIGLNSKNPSFQRITNVVRASTGNSPQFTQPYYSAFANYVLPLTAETQVILKASLNSYPGRGERIVHSSIKAHLLRAV